MQLDLNDFSPNARYHLMTQVILPRPIAWVLTANEDASLNLAPFSYFNAICSDPPLVVMSVGHKADQSVKDTRHNLLSGRDAVLHIPSTSQAPSVSLTSESLDYGEPELVLLDDQARLVDFSGCPLPRLADCPIALHVSLDSVHEIGPARQAVFYLQIKQLYASDACASQDEQGRWSIDPEKVQPLSRLGRGLYAGLGVPFKA